MMGGFAAQIRSAKAVAPPTLTLALLSIGAFAAPVAAQGLGAEDLVQVRDMAITRCLEPMEAGGVADLAGLRPLANVGDTVFLDNAATLDDRVALDFSGVNGLRWCEVGTNSVVARMTGDDGFARVTEAFDTVAEDLLARGYVEDTSCTIAAFVLSGSRFLEEGDYLRRFSSPSETRPSVQLRVDLSAARLGYDAGIRVEEHYGMPEQGC